MRYGVSANIAADCERNLKLWPSAAVEMYSKANAECRNICELKTGPIETLISSS